MPKNKSVCLYVFYEGLWIIRDNSSKFLSICRPLCRSSVVSKHYWIPQCNSRMWVYFHSYCMFFESKSNVIFLVDPMTQSHKGLKWNAIQQARTMTETRAKVFGVIGKGLVTSSLCPQDMLLNCTSDPVASTVCLCFLAGFFFSECLKFFIFSFHCQAINCELWTNTYCRGGLQWR